MKYWIYPTIMVSVFEYFICACLWKAAACKNPEIYGIVYNFEQKAQGIFYYLKNLTVRHDDIYKSRICNIILWNFLSYLCRRSSAHRIHAGQCNSLATRVNKRVLHLIDMPFYIPCERNLPYQWQESMIYAIIDT